jgi:hypothetical protein
LRNAEHPTWRDADRAEGYHSVHGGGLVRPGEVHFEHIYWDQASVLAQIGLIDKDGLPVIGAEQAARLLDPSLPSDTLIPKASS